MAASGSDGVAGRLAFVATEIIEDYDFASEGAAPLRV
jgi:hypothetical protein